MSVQPPSDQGAASTPVQAHPGTATVLVVDDDESVRRLASALLRQGGFRVLEASTPAEAMRLSEWHRGAIDLLLTDVCLEPMNGAQLAKCIRTGRPKLAVVFYSGYSRESLVDEGVLPADAVFLQKPFRLATLSALVRDNVVPESQTFDTQPGRPAVRDTVDQSPGPNTKQ